MNDISTLYLADDHQIFRDALRPLLERVPHLHIVGEAADGRSALRDLAELRPDLALLDQSMPGLNGIEVTRRALELLPDLRVLMLSMHADRRFVTEALKAGAMGYVLKEASFDELLLAIDEVRRGRMYLSSVLSDLLLKEYVQQARDHDETAWSVLSPREREVLQLLAEGASTREIAERLHLSVKTVDTHRMQIKSKLQLTSVAELTKYAIREGITQLGD